MGKNGGTIGKYTNFAWKSKYFFQYFPNPFSFSLEIKKSKFQRQLLRAITKETSICFSSNTEQSLYFARKLESRRKNAD